MNRTQAWLSLIGFCFLSAARDVMAKHFFDAGDFGPAFVTWFGSLVTWILFYFLVCFKTRRPYLFRDIFRYDGRTKATILASNVCTLIAFLTTFMAVARLNAYANSLVDYGASPIVTLALGVVILGDRIERQVGVGVLLSLVGIVILVPALSDGGAGFSSAQVAGMALAFISCIAFGLNQILNKRLVLAGIRRERAILVRLPLLIVCLAAYAMAVQSREGHIAMAPMARLTIWSILGVTVPLYLLISSFERLNVQTISYGIFMIPVFSFIGSLFTKSITHGSLWIYVAAGALVVAGVILAERASVRSEAPVEARASTVRNVIVAGSADS
jgi:drug/metabolite transporter (DMT)-like permease